MLANYGYKDGSGEFYITIDTDKCNRCNAHGCAAACAPQVLEIITDDWDDVVAKVKDNQRQKIKYTCGPCKPGGYQKEHLPCVRGCGLGAISHSW